MQKCTYIGCAICRKWLNRAESCRIVSNRDAEPRNPFMVCSRVRCSIANRSHVALLLVIYGKILM